MTRESAKSETTKLTTDLFQLIKGIHCNYMLQGALSFNILDVEALHSHRLWSSAQEDEDADVEFSEPELQVNLRCACRIRAVSLKCLSVWLCIGFIHVNSLVEVENKN